MQTNSTQELEGYLDVEERDSREVQRDNLKRMAREMLVQPRPFFGGCAMLVLSTAAILVEPRLFGYVIDDAIVPRQWNLLQQLALVYLLIVVVRVGAQVGSAYLFELLGQRVTQELRCRLFSHLQRLPVTIFDKNPAGRLLTRVTNDIASLGEMFTAGFVSMIGNALMVLGIQIWLIALDAKLGLIAGSVLPFLLIASVYFSRKLRVAYREARSKLSALNAFLAENILGMKVVHLFNRERRHLDRFDRINQWYADARIGSIQVFAFFQPTITICSAVAVALIIYFGGKEALVGHIKVGVLFAYFSYILSMFQPLREIADKWNIFLSGMASAERIFAILDWKTELAADEVSGAARVSLPGASALRGHIVFEKVWFAYEAEHWVLRDFSLEIKPGSRVGIVGHTGAGKTTIISLLMRFYEPQKGRILLDGRDLREYSKRELRSAIGIIQQDVFLFSGSLRENMTFWGSQQAHPRELEALLEKFGASSGAGPSDSELLERGGNLSVGQRQVLAFARALTAKPQIWILDEATANMDSGSEAVLQEALGEASRGMTSILIAHRLATVRSAGQIVVIHKGALVEQGNHSELIARDGLYARLYRYQRSVETAESDTHTPARAGDPLRQRAPESVS